MDVGEGVPARLHQPLREGLDESLAIVRRWHGAADGRLRAALAPRFALSCSPELLRQTAHASATHDLLVHTHASEQREEVDLVRARTGFDNIEYFDTLGLATRRLCVAHCVWVSDREQALLAEREAKVLHCPTSNLKLGSGVAPVAERRARGVSVSLGADGGACANTLDMFQEMRLASGLQAMRRGPGAVTARDALWMATREGARALGLEADLGSIEVGKRADLIVLGRRAPHQRPAHDPFSTVVHASRPSDVRATIVDGRVVARDGQLAWADLGDVAAAAAQARQILRDRAGI
jgi:cytosine/adenosine deaminase-related metal-dependent hydrolase